MALPQLGRQEHDPWYPADHAAAGRACGGYPECDYDAAAVCGGLSGGAVSKAACILGSHGYDPGIKRQLEDEYVLAGRSCQLPVYYGLYPAFCMVLSEGTAGEPKIYISGCV